MDPDDPNYPTEHRKLLTTMAMALHQKIAELVGEESVEFYYRDAMEAAMEIVRESPLIDFIKGTPDEIIDRLFERVEERVKQRLNRPN